MGKEEVRAVKLRIADIICNRWMASRKLGEGGCGVIYEVFNLSRPDERMACKAELSGRNKEDEILKLEGKVLSLLNEAHSYHSPKFIREGTERNYNYLIMSLLGPSISDLRKQLPTKQVGLDKETIEQKFTLFTTMAVAIQCIDAIKEIHDIGYLHRDIKPSNFTIGLMGTSRERILYLVDFGLARKFMNLAADGKTKELRKKRKFVAFRGTVRYCSLNVHAQEEQSRHDDIWSLIYMLIEMYHGDLPWAKCGNLHREEAERIKTDTESKLMEKCPKEFGIIIGHLKNLNYSTTPHYELIRALFCRVILRDCVGIRKFDWEKGGAFEKILRRPSLLQTELEKPVASLLEILDLHRVETRPSKEVVIPISQTNEPAGTHSSVDDTIEAPVDEKKIENTAAAVSTKPSNAKYTYRAKDKIKDPSTNNL